MHCYNYYGHYFHFNIPNKPVAIVVIDTDHRTCPLVYDTKSITF